MLPMTMSEMMMAFPVMQDKYRQRYARAVVDLLSCGLKSFESGL